MRYEKLPIARLRAPGAGDRRGAVRIWAAVRSRGCKSAPCRAYDTEPPTMAVRQARPQARGVTNPAITAMMARVGTRPGATPVRAHRVHHPPMKACSQCGAYGGDGGAGGDDGKGGGGEGGER
eukprot:scaffold4298_cov99-Isochrysis_galbana.AAC.6